MKKPSSVSALAVPSCDSAKHLHLQNLVDSLLAIIFSIDKLGVFTFVNKAAIEVWGYTPEELKGTSIYDIVAIEDHEITRNYISRMSKGHSVLHFENRFIKKDGSEVPVSWAGRWNGSDELLYCTARDITERKKLAVLQSQYEARLRRQYDEMNEMLERITDAFYVLDDHWRITYANQQAQKAVNRSLDEVYMKSIWESFPEMVGTEFEVQFKRAIRQQVSVSFEAQFCGAVSFWAEVNAYPSAKGLSVFFRNVNERKKAELERVMYEYRIQEQSNRLSQILDRITDAFYAVDQNFVITYFNHEAECLSGKPREEMISKTIWDAFPKSVGTSIETNLRKALEEQVPVYFEAPSTMRPLLLEFSAYPSANGLTVFYRDITEKKKIAEKLQRLSLIARKTMNSVVVLSPENKVMWVNEAFIQLTGYDLEEILGKTPGELLDGPGTDRKTLELIRQMQKENKPYHAEILNYKKNGETFWSEVQGQPLFDNKGNLMQYFSIETDITERKQLENQLEEQRKKATADVISAQEKERSQIGLELHDNVNQVLTTVKLYTELCRDGVGNTSEIMDKSIKLLQDSINEIRSLSKRLSAPSLGSIKLYESVKELIDSIADTNKMQITFDACPVQALEVGRDLHMAVYRILQEHMTNIIRHAKASNVTVLLDLDGQNLLLQVVDNGIGFDTCKKQSGIGITNMITRAESINGELQLHSQIGKGCVLTGKFPVV